MQQIGVIGMAVMGKNLALNIKNQGFSVSVYSITTSELDEVSTHYEDEQMKVTHSWVEFVNSLEKPRKIILMIKAGAPVDETIGQLKNLLSEGDIIVDGGNSLFTDTNRRYEDLAQSHINYVGLGVSGGELGALNGPALMPGGDEAAYQKLAPIFNRIAAKGPEGNPCVDYIGPKGSGHYVKMVHNGIEYGIMQLICEVYDVMRQALMMDNQAISEQFAAWNQGKLHAYLVDATAKVLAQSDVETGSDMVDMILNKASYKGTGNWMLEDAVKLGAPISVIAEAVFARFISNQVLAGKLTLESSKTSKKFVVDTQTLERALYLTQVVSYAQGFQQLMLASDRYAWDLKCSNISSVWEAGCIIQAKSLVDIRKAFARDPELINIFQDQFFKKVIEENIDALQAVVQLAMSQYIPVPALSAALSYLNSIFNHNLPANLLQAQRDYFGAHMYERIDKPGIFHTHWYVEA